MIATLISLGYFENLGAYIKNFYSSHPYYFSFILLIIGILFIVSFVKILNNMFFK